MGEVCCTLFYLDIVCNYKNAYFKVELKKYMVNLNIFSLFRNPSQKSAPVSLTRGQVYYTEVLMKEGGGGDHVSVGVKLPSGVLQRPIANNDVYIKPPGRVLGHYSFFNDLA